MYFAIKLYSECYEISSKRLRYFINIENLIDLGVLTIIGFTIWYAFNLLFTKDVSLLDEERNSGQIMKQMRIV